MSEDTKENQINSDYTRVVPITSQDQVASYNKQKSEAETKQSIPVPVTPDNKPTSLNTPTIAMPQPPIAEETKITETTPPFWKRLLGIK